MNTDLHLSFGSQTDTGSKKEFNTDSVLEFAILKGHVFVVCDGHNGPEGHGALASKLIVESIKKYFYNRSYKDMAKALTNAITYANITLFEQSTKDKKYNGISSTLAIVIFREGKLYYAYAGDSRIYFFRNGEMQPLTRDHVVDFENIKDSELKVALGRTKDVKFGVCKNPITMSEGESLLLCTDGLTDQVPETVIAEILGDDNMAADHKCKRLIELANEQGGDDCISVQVLEFSQVMELQKERKKINLKPVLYILIAIIAILAVGYGGYKGYHSFKNRPVKEKTVTELPEPVIENTAKEKPNEASSTKPETQIKTSKPKEVAVNQGTPKQQKTKTVTVSKPVDEMVYYHHEIVYGENLYRLSLRYNVSQQKLIDINGKKATSFIAGTELKIPVKALHTVKKGESYSVISDMYNVKVKLICAASKIDDGTPLKEGQVLIIPLTK